MTNRSQEGSLTSGANSAATTGDQRWEFGSEEWRAVSIPHEYKDGTTHMWAVRYESQTGSVVEIGDWLTEPVARLVSAAPEMLEALNAVMAEWRDGYGLRCEKQVRFAIGKATGSALTNRDNAAAGDGG